MRQRASSLYGPFVTSLLNAGLYFLGAAVQSRGRALCFATVSVARDAPQASWAARQDGGADGHTKNSQACDDDQCNKEESRSQKTRHEQRQTDREHRSDDKAGSDDQRRKTGFFRHGSSL